VRLWNRASKTPWPQALLRDIQPCLAQSVLPQLLLSHDFLELRYVKGATRGRRHSALARFQSWKWKAIKQALLNLLMGRGRVLDNMIAMRT